MMTCARMRTKVIIVVQRKQCGWNGPSVVVKLYHLVLVLCLDRIGGMPTRDITLFYPRSGDQSLVERTDQ